MLSDLNVLLGIELQLNLKIGIKFQSLHYLYFAEIVAESPSNKHMASI